MLVLLISKSVTSHTLYGVSLMLALALTMSDHYETWLVFMVVLQRPAVAVPWHMLIHRLKNHQR